MTSEDEFVLLPETSGSVFRKQSREQLGDRVRVLSDTLAQVCNAIGVSLASVIKQVSRTLRSVATASWRKLS